MTDAAGAAGSARAAAPNAPLRQARLLALVAVGGVSAVTLGLWTLSQGVPSLGVAETIQALLGPSPADSSGLIVRDVRAPRLVVALIAGAALGSAGAILQIALRNPIADPGLLGVSQAAILAFVVTLFFPTLIPAPLTGPPLAIAAGLLAGAGVVVLASRTRDPVDFILVSVLLGTTITIVTTFLLFQLEWAVRTAQTFLRFTAGSLSASTWTDVAVTLPWLAVGLPLAVISGRILNVLQLGDDVASNLGLRVNRARFIVVSVAVLLVAPVVAVTGPMIFVALLAPHIVRGALRTTNAYSVVAGSAVVGASVALAADGLGRLLFFPNEIPAGIWTVIVAGPLAVRLAITRLSVHGVVA